MRGAHGFPPTTSSAEENPNFAQALERRTKRRDDRRNPVASDGLPKRRLKRHPAPLSTIPGIR